MARLAERTGRRYHVVDYFGDPEAERVLVVMGSGGETVQETVAALNARGERVGVAQVRLYRPFPAQALVAALPATARRIAVLDRTKEPGSMGEPLFLDAVAALSESFADGERAVMPRVVGGRYGLSSKEFTPGMVAGVFAELAARPAATPFHDRHQRRRLRDRASTTTRRSTSSRPRRCARSSSAWARTARSARTRTRSRSSATSGPACAGLLRLRLEEVRLADGLAPPLRAEADPGAVPRAAGGLRRLPPVRAARAGRRARAGGADGATVLLNCPHPPDEVWEALSRPVQEQILAKRVDVYAIDADRIARDVGLAGRTNIVLQTCFFALSGVLPREEAIERIKAAVAKTYGRRGAEVVARNQAAVDRALDGPPPGRRAPTGDGDARAAARSCPRTRRSSFARSRRRCWPAGATSSRSARCRWTARIRAGRRPSRSATSPSWSPCGTPTSVSSAATAASSARTA